MKKKIVGTGITQRVVVSYDATTSEDAPAIYEMMKRNLSGPFNFEGLILKPIEETSWRLLEQAGLTRKKLLEMVEELYCKITEGKVTGPGKDECNLIMAAATLTHDKPDSKEGYGAHWLNDIRNIRVWSKKYPDLALQEAFQLGQSYKEAEMKFRWEKDALRAYRSRVAFTRGRNSRNESTRQDARMKRFRWQLEANKVWQKHPNFGRLKVAEVIAQAGESVETIRRKIIPPAKDLPEK